MSIHPTAIIDAGATLASDVEVGPYAIVGAGVQLDAGVRVGAHAVLTGPMSVGARTRIHPHAVLGGDPQDLKYAGEDTRVEIGPDNTFREFATVNRGTTQGGGVTRIGAGNLFMAYSHVAHDCIIGDHAVLANSVALAGHVEIGDRAVLSGLVAVHQYARVGRCAMVGGGGMVAQDVPPFMIAQGDRARLFGLNIVGLRRAGFPADTIAALKRAYRELFGQGLPLRIAMEHARERFADVGEVTELLAFIEGSNRGICRAAGHDGDEQG
jgi:UDP-N-acetylglucosamine acyltransferase